ncbi:recombinase RecJ, partial [Halobacteriales archaeon QH_7_69_31]
MDVPVPELDARARTCADALLDADRVLLASHIDADGLTSAGVAAPALRRADVPFEAVFEKQLDADTIAGFADREYDT